MQRQAFEAAAAEFEKALAGEPDSPVARYHYAICLFAVGRNEDARREFDRLAKSSGETPELSYYLGRLDLLDNQPAAAAARLQKLADNPKTPDAPYYLGLAYVAAGDSKSGLKWLERAEKLRPKDYHVHYRLARLYTNSGRAADAEREFKLYNQYRDEERTTEADLRGCSQGNSDACRRLYDPNDPEKLVLLGQIYGERGAFGEAIEPLRRAVQVDPGSFDGWHNLGLSYFRLQRYQEARQPLEKAAALRPDYFDTLNLLGATLYMLGDDRGALPVMERAHQLHPDDAQLGQALINLRKSVEAAKPK